MSARQAGAQGGAGGYMCSPYLQRCTGDGVVLAAAANDESPPPARPWSSLRHGAKGHGWGAIVGVGGSRSKRQASLDDANPAGPASPARPQHTPRRRLWQLGQTTAATAHAIHAMPPQLADRGGGCDKEGSTLQPSAWLLVGWGWFCAEGRGHRKWPAHLMQLAGTSARSPQ